MGLPVTSPRFGSRCRLTRAVRGRYATYTPCCGGEASRRRFPRKAATNWVRGETSEFDLHHTHQEAGPTDEDLLTLHVAPSPHIAQLIANLLVEAGIPAYVEGQHLADEAAMAQMALGVIGREIQVPRAAIDEARDLLAAMKQAGEEMSEDEPGEE